MNKSEQALQNANANLNSAKMQLQLAQETFDSLQAPQSGSMAEMNAARVLIQSQREVIKHNQEWVKFAENQVELAKKKLQSDMIEYEKFNYLELEDIKKKLKEIKVQEAKNLDEIALMTYPIKNKKEAL